MSMGKREIAAGTNFVIKATNGSKRMFVTLHELDNILDLRDLLQVLRKR